MQDRPLTATEPPHRPVADAIGDYAIFLLDPQGRVSSWNPGAQHIKEFTAEEVVGKHFSMFFAEEDRRDCPEIGGITPPSPMSDVAGTPVQIAGQTQNRV